MLQSGVTAPARHLPTNLKRPKYAQYISQSSALRVVYPCVRWATRWATPHSLSTGADVRVSARRSSYSLNPARLTLPRESLGPHMSGCECDAQKVAC